MEVPTLPPMAFDPLALVEETADAVEGSMSALNGQASHQGVRPNVTSPLFLPVGSVSGNHMILLRVTTSASYVRTGRVVDIMLTLSFVPGHCAQVIVNFATSAVEEFMIAKREREEYKAAL